MLAPNIAVAYLLAVPISRVPHIYPKFSDSARAYYKGVAVATLLGACWVAREARHPTCLCPNLAVYSYTCHKGAKGA
ncbi:MAG: hypothetical protein HY785_04340 [Oscillatoriophycideae cyanobacterium NC_groundwater_1537_Pr4_S-0.65um_50_18]|nr:hypothetical protein [Oscillatoriophycideae cyanobacterium NC_groundwater_1537_Pr4_S-0.65um_50_18]